MNNWIYVRNDPSNDLKQRKVTLRNDTLGAFFANYLSFQESEKNGNNSLLIQLILQEAPVWSS